MLCDTFSILLQFTDGYFNENLQSTIGKFEYGYEITSLWSVE